jgi:P-type conjugative transfer protein TrbJ
MEVFMKRQIVLITTIAVLLLFGGPTPQVEAGGVFATEVTQLLNHVQLLKQYLQQVQMVQNDLSRYANMLQNTHVLPNQLVGPVLQDLGQLAQVVQGGQALAYSMSNLNAQFANRFKGYNGAYNPTTYYQNYENWSQTSLDTTFSTLRAMGLQGQQLQNSQSFLAAMRQRMTTPQGRLDAIQISTEVSEQQVEQLMMLRELMIVDLQSKQAYQAQQVQNEQAAAAGEQTFFGYRPWQSDGYSPPLP